MDFSSLFKETRKSLKGKTFLVMFMVFIYVVVVEGCSIAQNVMDIINVLKDNGNSYDTTQPFWIIIVTFILEALLIVGYTNVMLNVAKGKDVKLGDLISDWRIGFKAMCLIMLEFIYTILWMMLFIVPGIVKAYSYSMSLYILAEDPSKGINQCITESRELMDGNKLNLFGINLIFGAIVFGSLCVVCIPAAIVIMYVLAHSSNNIVFLSIVAILILAWLIIVFWLSAIQEVLTAHFYLKVSRQESLVKKLVSDSNVSINNDTINDVDVIE